MLSLCVNAHRLDRKGVGVRLLSRLAVRGGAAVLVQLTCRAGGDLPACAARLRDWGFACRRFPLGVRRQGFDLVLLSIGSGLPSSLAEFTADGPNSSSPPDTSSSSAGPSSGEAEAMVGT